MSRSEFFNKVPGQDPLQISETDLKGRPIFLEITVFLGQKIDKIWTDSKL